MMSTSTQSRQNIATRNSSATLPPQTTEVSSSWEKLAQLGFSINDVLILAQAWGELPSLTRKTMLKNYLTKNKSDALEKIIRKQQQKVSKNLEETYKKILKNHWYPYNARHSNPELLFDFAKIHGMGQMDQIDLDDIEFKIAEFLSQDPNNPLLLHDLKTAFAEIKTRHIASTEHLHQMGFSLNEILGIAHKWNKSYADTLVGIATQIVTEEFNRVEAKQKASNLKRKAPKAKRKSKK